MPGFDHQLGDVVMVSGSGRRMMIVDLPPDRPWAVLAWLPAPGKPPIEAMAHLSTLLPCAPPAGR